MTAATEDDMAVGCVGTRAAAAPVQRGKRLGSSQVARGLGSSLKWGHVFPEKWWPKARQRVPFTRLSARQTMEPCEDLRCQCCEGEETRGQQRTQAFPEGAAGGGLSQHGLWPTAVGASGASRPRTTPAAPGALTTTKNTKQTNTRRNTAAMAKAYHQHSSAGPRGSPPEVRGEG